MIRFSGAGDTDVGLIRSQNEDAAFLSPFCALVADGVGGGAAGEVASATAAYAVTATLLARRTEDPAAVLASGVAVAQAQVRAGVEQDSDREGMATTLTALATDGARIALAHLGDSRGYVFHDGELTRVTRDHTYVQDLLDEGRLDPGDVADHPWRNVVMRSVNGHAEGEPDIIELNLVPGDRVLLATDGLTDLVGDAEIARTLATRNDDDAVSAFLATALTRGGRDNITCLVVTIIDGPEVSADGLLLGAVRDPRNVVDIAAVRAESA